MKVDYLRRTAELCVIVNTCLNLVLIIALFVVGVHIKGEYVRLNASAEAMHARSILQDTSVITRKAAGINMTEPLMEPNDTRELMSSVTDALQVFSHSVRGLQGETVNYAIQIASSPETRLFVSQTIDRFLTDVDRLEKGIEYVARLLAPKSGSV